LQNWRADWFSGGILTFVGSGGATGGSTTTLITDNTHADTEHQNYCWWDPARFGLSLCQGSGDHR
jgi:hypothetical protein